MAEVGPQWDQFIDLSHDPATHEVDPRLCKFVNLCNTVYFTPNKSSFAQNLSQARSSTTVWS